MDVKLVVVGGRNAGQEIKVEKEEFRIGKSSRCHLRLGSSSVGDLHCTILRCEGSARIKDHGTPSGTLINGERVEGERTLKNEDILHVGSLEFKIQLSVGVSGKKKPKVHSVGEAAARVAQTPSKKVASDDVDLFSIFGETVPSEDELPEFASRKNHDHTEEEADEKEVESELDKEKKVQESTRNAAADVIKTILGQARK